jgi:periplasmic divalent cation tolerance protein
MMPEQDTKQALVVLCTCADAENAAQLAKGIVGTGLAACVNVLSEIRSIYRWRGKVQDEAETLMIIKTTRARYADLEAWLRDNHPYDVPEVLALPVVAGSEPYIAWLTAETS